MKNIKKLLASALVLGLAIQLRAAPVTVFAAASLTESLQEIAAHYEKQSGDKIGFNFAASGTLARQIEEGAPADIFFSADETKADALEHKGWLVKETRKSRLGNSLVIVTVLEGPPSNSPAYLTNAAGQRVALGDPKIVPAGTYAKAYLEKNGLWSGVEPKMVPCASVRAVLAAVESGNIDAGVVYKTDAAISKTVKVAFEVPVADGPQITYPMALVAHAPNPAAAKKFLDYLAGSEAAAVFVRHGFTVLSPAGK